MTQWVVAFPAFATPYGLPIPVRSTYRDGVALDETPSGKIITGGELQVEMEWGSTLSTMLSAADYAQIASRIQTDGTLLFYLPNRSEQQVWVQGLTDPLPALARWRGMVPGFVLTLRRCSVVG